MSTTYRVSFLAGRICTRCLKVNPSAYYHASKIIAAQLSPAVVRQKKLLGQIQRSNLQKDNNYDCEESLPPLPLLQAAFESGALKINPEKALGFLRSYKNIGGSSQKLEQKLCREQNITTGTVTLLALILRRCKTKAQQSLARSLILSASAMGDRTATFEIISSAIRTNSIHHYHMVRTRLEILANNGDQQAMMLLGKVLFYTNSEKRSLSWLQKATHPITGNLNFEGASECLVLIGRILQKQSDLAGAKSAFEKAAKQLNDPQAYFYLSKMEANGTSLQVDYLLKAASAGITEAWYNLGVIELDKIQKNGKQPKKLEDYGIARDWFLVAAYDGHGPSMLNLAIMSKISQNLDEAFAWLKKAESTPNVSMEVEKLRLEWTSVTS
ncbi:putative hcp-like protein [Golovinomyces cichoracearum]|uniref:Putative hcp-like protein n=1 Tax=Golovinomyces cichoracearum TaxID=62708 RepID=A0A420HCZ5_9PEZI|nr:putative hcp-like protein [Golovinomyces cichoracearum]